ncbi:Tetratricopeptide repeat protein 25 [Dinochytrium kinnereticum]|nr:Tetratricopeptide repeat protein 25 [Dinochytrium kinnereticum]
MCTVTVSESNVSQMAEALGIKVAGIERVIGDGTRPEIRFNARRKLYVQEISSTSIWSDLQSDGHSSSKGSAGGQIAINILSLRPSPHLACKLLESMTTDSKPPAAAPASGDDESESPENLVAKFQTLSAEGDLLSKKRSFIEAIDIFTRALDIRPTDKHCLVARSQCYIQIGAADQALCDADAALKEFPDYFKAILQKAEALYAKGDFELALMHFHRGNRQRPELDEFRVGIQKAREAIENSIGHPTDFKIQAVPHSSKPPITGTTPNNVSPSCNPAAVNGGAPGSNANTNALPCAGGTRLTPLMESKLLGELYEDKCYLQSLASDRDFVDHPDTAIMDLVNEGLRYLTTRLDFWKQQNPLYARPKVKKIRPRLEKRTVVPHHVEVQKQQRGPPVIVPGVVSN